MEKVELTPLTLEDKEAFIKDNQAAFNYGALEEFGRHNDHFEEEGKSSHEKRLKHQSLMEKLIALFTKV